MATRFARQGVALLLALPVMAVWLVEKIPGTRSSVHELPILYITYLGDGACALSGALAAGKRGMDLFGCVVVGFVTTLGGGTVRDITMGRTPVFWMLDWDEAVLTVLTSALTFFLWPRLSSALGASAESEWLYWADTLGLGAFAANGALAAIAFDPRMHCGACAVCGLFSATFGGLVKDVLCQQPPRILYSAEELYAVPALVGAAVTTMVVRYMGEHLVSEAVLSGFWVTVELRVLAVNHALRLPTFQLDDGQPFGKGKTE